VPHIPPLGHCATHPGGEINTESTFAAKPPRPQRIAYDYLVPHLEQATGLPRTSKFLEKSGKMSSWHSRRTGEAGIRFTSHGFRPRFFSVTELPPPDLSFNPHIRSRRSSISLSANI